MEGVIMIVKNSWETREAPACWGDGVHGWEHIREVMAKLLILTFEPDAERDGLVKSLNGPMPDDVWDELDALDALNEATEDGSFWGLFDGDLIHMLDGGDPDDVPTRHSAR
jgi:hypothetical protein